MGEGDGISVTASRVTLAIRMVAARLGFGGRVSVDHRGVAE
jgi:hypothetical protein